MKKRIFTALDAACKPSALLATNTSTLDIDEIASSTTRPEAVVGMHFFSPANVMPLLEVVQGAASSAEATATAMALGKRLRKKAVLARNAFGFIGNRMLEPCLRRSRLTPIHSSHAGGMLTAHAGCISATSRSHLGYLSRISVASRLHIGRI